MVSVKFHADANEELLEAVDWYRERSTTAAAGFIREIEHAVSRIAESPERYPMTRFGRRRFVLQSYPYDVVYRVRVELVEIVAIAHHARRPAYWRRR